MLTVTDTSHQSPSKLGSDLVKKDVVGIAARRLVVVNHPNSGLGLADVATGDIEGITATVIYPTYNAALAISDMPVA